MNITLQKGGRCVRWVGSRYLLISEQKPADACTHGKNPYEVSCGCQCALIYSIALSNLFKRLVLVARDIVAVLNERVCGVRVHALQLYIFNRSQLHCIGASGEEQNAILKGGEERSG